MADPQIPETWPVLAAELAGQPADVLVVGAADSGKSTLCRWLAMHWARAGQPTWLIGADIGQSHFGPPAAIGCVRMGPDGPGEAAAFFVGDVSPRRAVPEVLAAYADAVRLTGGARRIVDSAGWTMGPGAVALKRAKAALLSEAHVVLIEREDELRAFRRAWRGLERFPLHIVAPAPEVRRRPPEERRRYREAAFREHLAGSVACEMDLGAVAAWGTGPLHRACPEAPEGLLLGLSDGRGRLLGLGVLDRLDAAEGRLVCRCRPEGGAASEVRFGRLLVGPDGTHTPIEATGEAP